MPCLICCLILCALSHLLSHLCALSHLLSHFVTKKASAVLSALRVTGFRRLLRRQGHDEAEATRGDGDDIEAPRLLHVIVLDATIAGMPKNETSEGEYLGKHYSNKLSKQNAVVAANLLVLVHNVHCVARLPPAAVMRQGR